MYFNIYKIKLNGTNEKRIGKTEAIDSIINRSEKPDKLIEEIADCISNLTNITEANSYFEKIMSENPLMEKLGINVYKYKDYFVNIGKIFNIKAHAGRLQEVRNMNLSSAPEIIAYADLKNFSDCILITKIAKTERGIPVPYSQVKSDVSVEAKQNLISDVDKLMNKRLANWNMLDENNWYVVPESGRIIISNWTNLMGFADEASKNTFRNSICDMCHFVYK